MDAMARSEALETSGGMGLPEFVATLERYLAEEPQLALKDKAKIQQLLECVYDEPALVVEAVIDC